LLTNLAAPCAAWTMSIVHNSFEGGHQNRPIERKHARGRGRLTPTLKELQTAGFEAPRAIAAALDERGYPCRPGR
jgi:hypothetical protein